MKPNNSIKKSDKPLNQRSLDENIKSLIKICTKQSGQISELLGRIESLEDLLIEKSFNAPNPTEIQPEPIKGIKGLAKFLGVSQVTAQKLKNSGNIPYSQFERIILFDPAKLMAALENKTK